MRKPYPDDLNDKEWGADQTDSGKSQKGAGSPSNSRQTRNTQRTILHAANGVPMETFA